VIADTSVVIAILKDEQDAAPIAAILSRSRDCRMSAVSYVKAAVVVDRRTLHRLRVSAVNPTYSTVTDFAKFLG
jgi:uncharacterized protein with PIN domain